MTIDDQTGQRLEELSCKDTPQQRPFHVVLVDIRQAASGKTHCVEFPLEEAPSYVALSYRWGELQEKMIDTNVGYIATVVSFRLEDFFQMCRAMTLEAELRSIRYVWVDAICVDQTNHVKRKNTIHHMTDIYERATFVVAVPDLHLQYLKNSFTSHRSIILRAAPFRKDIYYLLHKRIDALKLLEQERLDFYRVPKDPALRQLLTDYTNFFADGFTTFRQHRHDYNPGEILDHIYDSYKTEPSAHSQLPCAEMTPMSENTILKEIQQLHDCCNKETCPFISFIHHGKSSHPPHHHQRVAQKQKPPVSSETSNRSGRNRQWKQQIYDRSGIIQDAMDFLTNLMVDWSSRAWVVSEFNIAKRKNNLKYWFVQLIPGAIKEIHPTFGTDFTFFTFDFNDPSHAEMQNITIKPPSRSSKLTSSDPVYLKYHQTMVRQLNEQTFLEMMLKSKATRHEDRFYSVLPLSAKYKHKLLTDKESVASWDIRTMLSVKLQLYEWMDTKDKLNLLFLSCYRKEPDVTLILPTFATTNIYWPPSADCFTTSDDASPSLFNFDLSNESTIMLRHDKDDGCDGLYYLHLAPFEYFVYSNQYHPHQKTCEVFLLEKTTLCDRLGLNERDRLDVVAIPNVISSLVPHQGPPFRIYLIGNFAKNKWVLEKCTLTNLPTNSSDWTHCNSHDNNHSHFDIY